LSVSINETGAFPSASVVKIAVACAAVDCEGLDLSQPVSIRDLDETFYCSVLQAFDPGDQLTLKSLIGLMLIVSDNPATTAILDAVGMDRVNHWLQTNGLTDTNITVGFDDASLGAPLRANLTTARDCLRLLQLVASEPRYAPIKHFLANNLRNERIPKWLPDEAVIAHKTGTLNGLCHDIALIESPNAACFLVILADDLPDGHDFAGEIARFSKQIYELMAR
jgi:beta-lactamase class A